RLAVPPVGGAREAAAAVPSMTRVLVGVTVPPVIARVAPAPTVRAAPETDPPATAKVPAAIVVGPVYMLGPVSVSGPAPNWVRPAGPLMTPESAPLTALFTVLVEASVTGWAMLTPSVRNSRPPAAAAFMSSFRAWPAAPRAASALTASVPPERTT